MKKTSSNIFRIIITILFLSFLGLYAIGNSSYYDYNASRKSQLTKEEIAKFEEMIANGEKIDIDSYYYTKDTDYNNLISSTSLKLSHQVGKTFQKIVTLIFNGLDNAISNN